MIFMSRRPIKQGKSASYPTVALSGTNYFTFNFPNQNISTTGFTELLPTLPAGYILNASRVIGGKPIVILNKYDASGSFGKLMSFQYSGGAFTPIDSIPRQWVPHDLEDAFNDGRLSTLVQDEGATELFTSNTAREFVLRKYDVCRFGRRLGKSVVRL